MSDQTISVDRAPGTRPLAAIILAAGKGTRMPGDLPKVAHPVASRAIVRWVVDAVRKAGVGRIILVVGYGAERVRAIFAGDDGDIEYVVQARQLGTGDAARCAADALRGFDGDVLVLAGDGPLIRPSTIEAMRARHVEQAAAATLATSVIADPSGYGRIIRDAAGRFVAIVEHAAATPEQRAIHEVYPSYACFDARRLMETLERLRPNETSGEYHVTDVPALLAAAGHRVEVVDAVPPEDVLSINTPEQLAEVEAILASRMEVAGR